MTIDERDAMFHLLRRKNTTAPMSLQLQSLRDIVEAELNAGHRTVISQEGLDVVVISEAYVWRIFENGSFLQTSAEG